MTCEIFLLRFATLAVEALRLGNLLFLVPLLAPLVIIKVRGQT